MCTCARNYWLVTLALFGAAAALLLTYTPTELTMGPIQKIFYLHLPVAIATFFAFLVSFVASLLYVWQREMKWDRLASSGASVGVALCSVVLLTGMIWGRGAWGQWWTWSPRLTFSLVLWLLYVVYVMVRGSIESSQRRALVAAVYGIIAFLDVPLVYLSTRLMPDIHPASVQLATEMKLTLAAWFVPVFMLAGGLLVAKFKLETAQAALESAAQDEPIAEPARQTWAGGVA